MNELSHVGALSVVKTRERGAVREGDVEAEDEEGGELKVGEEGAAWRGTLRKRDTKKARR